VVTWGSPLFVAALTVLAAPRATAGVNRWTSVGPEGATVHSLAIAPTDPAIVYAGTERRVFKSGNGGSIWFDGSHGIPASSPGTVTQVKVLEVHPNDADTLYAGARYQGLFKSQDGGLLWTHIASLQTGDRSVFDLAIDPMNPEILYVATYNGLYKSLNGGTSWVRTDPGFLEVQSVELDPINPSQIYAAVAAAGIFRSLDGGITWTTANRGLPPGGDVNTFARMLNLAHHPFSAGLLYAHTQRGLYKTTNGGTDWFYASRTPGHPQSEPLYGLEADAANNLYAATGKGLYISADGGHNWSPIGSAVLPTPVTSVAVVPFRPGTVYAGAGDAVFKTEDAGATWATSKKGLANVAVSAIALDPSDARNVYASGWRPGNFYKRVNGGRGLWRRSDAGIGGPQISSIAIAAAEPSRLYAAGSGGLYRSEDKGEAWTVAGPVPFPYLPCMVMDAFDSQILYVGTCCGIRGSSQGVYKTMDGGRSWSQKQNGFLRTEEKWVLALAADPQTPGVLYAGTRGGVFKTTDGGESWNRTPLTQSIASLAIDPREPATLYAALSRGGVFRSDDGGGTWRAVAAGISHLVTSSLAIDPMAPSTLYAGTRGGGVFRSADRGETWIPFNEGLRDLFVASVAPDPTGRRLYAGTHSSGVFEYEIRGARVVPFRDNR